MYFFRRFPIKNTGIWQRKAETKKNITFSLSLFHKRKIVRAAQAHFIANALAHIHIDKRGKARWIQLHKKRIPFGVWRMCASASST
jgi:hypothetical protein